MSNSDFYPEDASSEDHPLRDRYTAWIEQIVRSTLKGNIRSKEQVYQQLVQEIEPNSHELFTTCLQIRKTQTQQQADDPSDELKQSKAIRSLRALQMIESEWQRFQTEQQTRGAIATALHQLLQATADERLLIFLNLSDPNHPQSLTPEQLQQLANSLRQQPISDKIGQQQITALATGILRGLAAANTLQPHLVSWMYRPGQIGFGSTPGARPWELWSQQDIGEQPRSLFRQLDQEQPASEWAERQSDLTLEDWVEVAIVLQSLQRGLIRWAENLIYSAKLGSKLAITLFLTFAVIWSELASGFRRSAFLNATHRQQFAEACFRATLQGLRLFAQRDYFPLYGTFFASFTGTYFRDAMQYLSEPLKQAAGTQEQARILTLLGSSQRALGALAAAKELHTTAWEIAQTAQDHRCEVANLNHLSRLHVLEKAYAEAIRCSQRALMLSRQFGDPMGEANALANLGYAEVAQAQQLEADLTVYETAIGYLEQGLRLSDRLGDLQSQALCATSLGSAYRVLNQPESALTYLELGGRAAAAAGDTYLQAINQADCAEAFYQLQRYLQALRSAGLAMYQLEQMGSTDWRSSAGLLSVLQGQLGEQFFPDLRSQLIPEIGVDGYDHIIELLQHYRRL